LAHQGVYRTDASPVLEKDGTVILVFRILDKNPESMLSDEDVPLKTVYPMRRGLHEFNRMAPFSRRDRECCIVRGRIMAG
jgi:hypothetical protein